MRILAVSALALGALSLATCAAPDDGGAGVSPATRTGPEWPEVTGNDPDLNPDDRLWRPADHARTLIEASCPAHSARQEPLPIELSVAPVTPGTPAQMADKIPETAVLSGAWELSSPNSNFGGLSGLARLPASEGGGLLAVSDAGAFVWIGLENGAPASAKIAYMQGTGGEYLTGKKEADAEGLVWSDGLALVSFERSFRIEGFALSACGAAARAAGIARLPNRHNGRNIDDNQGPEAIFLGADGALGFGYEGMLGTSPLGRVFADGTAEWTGENAPAPSLHGLVGREIITAADGTAHTLELFRAWDPVQGNRIRLRWGNGETQSLTLSRPLLVDNFEGIAAEPLQDGRIRVWTVSDNNFSGSQKTLLYSFDITMPQN